MQNGGKPLHNHPSPAKKYVWIQIFWIFQERTWANMHTWLNYQKGGTRLGKKLLCFKRCTKWNRVLQNIRFCDPIHFQINHLLSKSFHLHVEKHWVWKGRVFAGRQRSKSCRSGGEIFGDDEFWVNNFRFISEIFGGAVLLPMSNVAPPKLQLRARCGGHSCRRST